MVDVFISYSRADKPLVSHLAKQIEAEGYDVWWDEELPPHKSYGEVISAKIAEAKAAIVVWSPTASASEWVRAEADMARNQKKLIQTSLGDIMPPLPFNQIQCADIGDWQGEADHSGWSKVKVSLADLCGARASGSAAGGVPIAPPPLNPAPAAPAALMSGGSSGGSSGASPKWPLFAGIGAAVLALIAAAVFFLGSDSAPPDNGAADGDGGGDPPIAVNDPSTSDPSPAPTPQSPESGTAPGATPTPSPSASSPPSASRGRIVGCYFWNSVYTYDGACRFVAGSGGDFTTFALDGPYFGEVVRIDLDVSVPGSGFVEFYYPDGKVERVKVRRSGNDRACWDGPSLTFCAR